MKIGNRIKIAVRRAWPSAAHLRLRNPRRIDSPHNQLQREPTKRATHSST